LAGDTDTDNRCAGGLLGTFAVLLALGYSINTLTLFGMVLAIGLLVDDAIVVVENVERLIQEEGLSPKEARKSMDELSGALVGIGVVLSAGVPAHGLLRWIDRDHLSAVLDHYRRPWPFR
jgi:multidrug efflux pump subunit AcrB